MSTRALGIGGAVAAVLLIGVVAFIASGSGESSQPSQATPSSGAVTGAPLDPPAAQAPAATDAAAVAAVTEPGAAALTTIVVDLRPWARVRVVPAVANAAVPAEPLYTPFSIDLPPGDYTLECENGGLTRAASLPLTVVAGVPQTLIRSMPGFNATKIVDGLLAQND
jgi:hypothetical protein